MYQFKGQFQKSIGWLASSSMTANQASVYGCVFTALYAVALYMGLTQESGRWLLLLIPPLGLFRLIMNALDGMLARKQGTASVAGEIMNELLDIFGDTICYGALLFVSGVPSVPVVVFLISSWFAEFVGILGKGLPGGIRRQESFGGGKTERMLWISFAAVGIFFAPQLFVFVSNFLWVISGFIVATGILRVRGILKISKGLIYQSHTLYGK